MTTVTQTLWSSAPSNPLDDIRAAIELMKKPTSPSRLLVRTVAPQWLPYKAPRLERERFSGGVNLSAQARNAARIAAAREEQDLTALVMRGTGEVFVSERGKAELKKRMAEAGAPAEAVPAALEFKSRPYALPSFSFKDLELPPGPPLALLPRVTYPHSGIHLQVF